ncbi:MAG: 4-hydroxy-tetrahydrodipicolinate synthase [Candidatus Baltobacteraceae bacterium]
MSARNGKALGRLLTAMLTPFDSKGEVDLAEARRLAAWLLAEGNDGLVVCGTTGESPALSDDERVALFAAVKTELGSRGTVIAGTGGNNTSASIALTKRAEAAGVDAILAVVPYYNKPTQDGMLRHFGALAEATELPIVVYNIPGRTAANMLPVTLLELAKRHSNIVGVKESSGDFTQFAAILRARPEGFAFWSGDDHLLLPALALGADGVVSVAAHLCAREMRQIIEAHARGDVARAAELHLELSPLFEGLFAITSPIPVKWAVGELGFAVGECRSPLGAMPKGLADALLPLIERYCVRANAVSLA